MWLSKSTRIIIAILSVAHCSDIDEENTFFPKIVIKPNSLNSECNEDIQRYQTSLHNLTLWAHEMYDATGKYPSGFLRADKFVPGNFRQCLTIKAPYQIKYCQSSIQVSVPELHPPRDPFSKDFSPYESVLRRVYKSPDPSQLSRNVVNIGFCIPASCSYLDLEVILNEYLSNVKHSLQRHNVSFKATVLPPFCQTELHKKFDLLDKSFCMLCVLLFALCLISAIFYSSSPHDELHNSRNIWSTILIAFSPKDNVKSFLNCYTSNTDLKMLYGIKTLVTCSMVVAHRYLVVVAYSNNNGDYTEELFRTKWFGILLRGDFLIDVMFIIGGLLTSYGLLVQFEKKAINPLLVFVLRYLRLSPVYAFIIFYHATLQEHGSFGAMWPVVVSPEVQMCRENWWLNLLYINNFINTKRFCMIQTWYLTNDVQLFILALLIVITISKNVTKGFVLLTTVLIASIIGTYVFIVTYKLWPFVIVYGYNMPSIRDTQYFKIIHANPVVRGQPYLVGIFAGYIYFKLKNSSERLSKKMSFAVAASSLLLILYVFAASSYYIDPYIKYNAIKSGLFAAHHRIVWALGAVGILFVISHGHASVVQSFLSWNVWIPLNKLSYSAYLVHMAIHFRALGAITSSSQFSVVEIIHLSIADMVVSFGLSFMVYIVIELPAQKLVNHLLGLSKPFKETKSSKDKKIKDA